MASLSGGGLTTEQIKSRYARRVEVFMEGKDDFSVYNNYWFGELADKIEFRLAEDGPAKLSGCKGVEQNVSLQRGAGIEAYGIIDRDYLDDAAVSCVTIDVDFLARNHAKNPHLYFTLRWELENYLVDPVTWERERVDFLHQGAGQRGEEDVIEELLQHCEALVPHAAANAYRKERGLPKIGDGECRNLPDRAAVEQYLHTKFVGQLDPIELAAFQIWVQRIEAFDDPAAPARERLYKLCRRIHGKALLDRFRYRHRLQLDIRFSVARALCDRVPPELNTRVRSWIR